MRKLMMGGMVILSLVCSWAVAQGDLQNPAVKFYEGNLAYKQNNYAQAMTLYEEVLNQGVASGALYYNLGNSYLKTQKMGKAILSYERAKIFIPRDSDLQSNLDYAVSLSKASSPISEISLLKRISHYYQDMFTAREMMWLAAFFCLLLGIAVIGAEMVSLSQWKQWVVIGILAFLALGQGVMWVSKSKDTLKAAVILEDAQARFEPSDQATQHFYLFAGEKIFVVKIEGAWAKIERLDGKLGWVQASSFEKILRFGKEQELQ